MKQITLLLTILIIFTFSLHAAEPDTITVILKGELKKSGVYNVEQGTMLSAVLRKARGTTENADGLNSYIIRKSIVSNQSYDLAKVVDEFKNSLISYITESKNSYRYNDLMSDGQKELMRKFDMLKPLGKMPIPITHYRLLKGSSDDVTLEDGDVITVPSASDNVYISGMVEKQTSVKYSPDMDWNDYIKAAGGFTENADRKNIYVIKENGISRKIINKLVSWSESNKRWEVTSFTNDRQVNPGETILVLPDAKQVEWLKDVSNPNEKMVDLLRLSDGFSYSDLALFR